MRVFIAVDLEGVTGTVDADEMYAGRPGFEQARCWMTGDANAAIAGAFDAGADEVVVCDAHGPGRSLLLDDLDPRAVLARGRAKPHRMVEGLEPGTDAVLLVGFHGRAGAAPGVLNHTWVGKELQDLRLDGRSAGELALVARYAGLRGAPVVLVTGDDVACAEAAEWIPGAETVAVKRAADRYAAHVLHPTVTADLIRAGARAGVERRGAVAPLDGAAPAELEIEWSSTAIATLCAKVPGVTAEGRTTRYAARDAAEVLDLLLVQSVLSGAIGDQPPYS